MDLISRGPEMEKKNLLWHLFPFFEHYEMHAKLKIAIIVETGKLVVWIFEE